MPIKVKTAISKPTNKTKPVYGVDMEALTISLNKLPTWMSYAVVPTATPKLDKEKKVTEVTVKATPIATKPTWKEYSKSTSKRQKEWDRMSASIDVYLKHQHAFFLEGVAVFAKVLKDKDLDKPGFDKLWKEQKTTFEEIHDAYASKTSEGTSLGVELKLIDPDPPEIKKDIKSPTVSDSYKVSGNTLDAVCTALDKRPSWGRYIANQDYDDSYALDGTLSKVTLSAKPVIKMPKWKEYSKATSDQKAEWNRMYAALLAHENNHHAKFVQALDNFATEIADKGLNKADFAKLWETRKKDLKKVQDGYDSSSDHGGKEGVSLDMNADPEP